MHKFSEIYYFIEEFNKQQQLDILKIFIKSVDKLIFLGMHEYESAKEKYPKFSNKFEFIPFAIDFKFWSHEDLNKNKFAFDEFLIQHC